MSNARALRWTWWGLAPALALVLFFGHQAERNSFKSDLAGLAQLGLYPLERDAQSPTGWRGGQRNQIISPDGCHWVMQTQQMLAEGTWRLREVAYDNFPEGREVHWSSSLHWWLGGLAWFWSTTSGSPLPLAVEEVAPYASPLLLLGVMAIVMPLIWRWFGRAAGGIFALGIVVIAPINDLFSLGDPDHHGLAAVCGMLTVLCLLAGENASANARRLYFASGVAGGTGLWISAATQAPLLLGIGIGALASTWLARRETSQKKSPAGVSPERWRWWGAAGAATSVFFYLLEYFPTHLGFRLEVNHPLYALAWLGGGELLARLSRLMGGGKFAESTRDRMIAAGAALGVSLLPVIVLTTGEQTFWVSDRMFWTLCADFIVEVGSVWRRLGMVAPTHWLEVFNPLPLLVLALGWSEFRGGASAAEKARLAIALAPATVVLILAVMQIRWMGMSSALWLIVLVGVVGLRVREKLPPIRSRGWQTVLVILSLAVCWPWITQTVSAGGVILRDEKGLSKLDLRLAVMRDLAQWLRARVGPERACVVLGEPSLTTALIYHGGCKGVGTLYWENKEGLRTMLEIFSPTSDAAAQTLIRSHGITHVVVVPWATYAEEAARLAPGFQRGASLSPDTLLAKLIRERDYPRWLRPVHYPAPEIGGLNDGFVLVYEVVAEQSLEEAALRAAQLRWARGENAAAERMLADVVRRYPNYLPGWIVTAQVQLGLNQTEKFRATYERIVALEAQANELALDDSIVLATLLAATGDVESLRRQVRRGVAVADEEALRKLSHTTLLNFILLAQDAGETDHHPAVLRLATGLLPEYLRERAQATPSAP